MATTAQQFATLLDNAQNDDTADGLDLERITTAVNTIREALNELDEALGTTDDQENE